MLFSIKWDRITYSNLFEESVSKKCYTAKCAIIPKVIDGTHIETKTLSLVFGAEGFCN